MHVIGAEKNTETRSIKTVQYSKKSERDEKRNEDDKRGNFFPLNNVAVKKAPKIFYYSHRKKKL